MPQKKETNTFDTVCEVLGERKTQRPQRVTIGAAEGRDFAVLHVNVTQGLSKNCFKVKLCHQSCLHPLVLIKTHYVTDIRNASYDSLCLLFKKNI